MEKNNRINQISWINALAIILVVIGHADMTPAYDQLWIKRWIYSFHMPLFVFVSGFLFCYTTSRIADISVSRFLKKKVKRLLLPFVVINTLIFFIKNFFSSNDYVQHPVELTWKSFFDSTLFYPIGFMWFLPTLFMIFVLFVFIARLIGFTNDRTWWWLGIAGGVWGIAQCMPHIQFLQMFNAISYSVYFIVGIIYAIWKKTIDYWLMKYKWIGLSVFSACSFSLLLPSVIAALIGIVWVLSLSLLVSEKVQNKFMAVSNYSFTIYLLSYFPQMLIRGPIYHHFEWINEYVFSVLSILLGVFVPIGIGRVYSHIKDVNKLTKFLGNIIGL